MTAAENLTNARTAVISLEGEDVQDYITVTQEEGHQCVDLGLSVLWATQNVGAESIEDPGDFFSWGETSPKTDYSKETYKWYSGSGYSKYSSRIDGLIMLEPDDDAANVNWGEGWRTPEDYEARELLEKCKITQETINGKKVFKLTSIVPGYEGNYIYIPDAYTIEGTKVISTSAKFWLSTQYPSVGNGSYLKINGDDPSYGIETGVMATMSYDGLPVRPVFGDYVIPVTSVKVDDRTASVKPGESIQLSATVLPEDATRKELSWSSSDTSIAVVDDTGTVTGLKVGYVDIIATSKDREITSKCQLTVDCGPVDYEYVDLGLSVKWGNKNIGSEKPHDTWGGYISWGETATKSKFTWETYKWCYGSYSSINKYVGGSRLLKPEDDIAYVTLGGNWRIPTVEEWEELLENCDYVWETVVKTGGYRFTSRVPGYEGKSIFIPAAGYETGGIRDMDFGIYWTANLTKTDDLSAQTFEFSDYYQPKIAAQGRYYGCKVRPVYGDPAISLNLNKTKHTMLVGKTVGLVASVNSSYEDKTVEWSSSDPSVATVSADGRVTSCSLGTAIITAKFRTAKATCEVNVVTVKDLDLTNSVKIIPYAPTVIIDVLGTHYYRQYSIENNSPVDIDLLKIMINKSSCSISGLVRAGEKVTKSFTTDFSGDVKTELTFLYEGKQYVVSTK